jgi:hypothetical protein
MYVLVHKERVIVGPRDWNRPMFDGALQKLKIQVLLPRRDPQELPIIIDTDTYITNAAITIPPHNEKIETYHGPYWNFENKNLAVGTYQIKEKQIGSIREFLTKEAANERYRKEVSGTTAEIQGVTVTLDTSRDGRNIFLQKYTLMGENDIVNWKFPEGWLALTKSDLGIAVSSGANHIQSAFDWEKAKIEEIEAAETATTLDAIIIVEQQEEEVEQPL